MESFKVAPSAEMRVVGGPNSNNFNVVPVLQMLDDTYDQVTFPTTSGRTVTTDTASLASDNTFTIDMLNAPTAAAFQDREPISLLLRVTATGETIERIMTIDLLAGTITIDGEELPDSGSGETAASVDATVENGVASGALKTEDIASALERDRGAGSIVFALNSDGADAAALTVSADAVQAVAEADAGLNIITENGTVKLDADTMDALAKAGRDAVVSVTKNADGSTTFDVAAEGESADVSFKVELPAADGGQVLAAVNPDGTKAVLRKSLVEDGVAYAVIPAGTTVQAIDNASAFRDVSTDAWYADAVDFASGHELFKGIGNEQFAPALPMTRAMLATVLYRLENAFAAGENPFSDVAPGTWYTDAVIWAHENGIVIGSDKGFEPAQPITREQIAVMLFRYMKALGIDADGSASLSVFPDGGDTADWARDAMQWAVSVELFQGDDNGALNPKGNATRAEVATLLMRMVKLIVK